MPIDHGAPEPLYRQLASILRDQIRDGTLQGMVPSIKRLAAEYNVADVTVRRAIGLLKEEGVVVTTSGRGTFVARKPG